jgi:hypothetical protein
MRIPPTARLMAGLLAVVALTGCGGGMSDGFASMSSGMSTGLGSNDYQRELRAREGARRSGVPYSIPPETGGMGGGANILPPATPLPAASPVSVTAQPLPPAAPLPAAQPFVPAAPATATAAIAPAAQPGGVAPQTFTPIPFGSRPAGAEIPPQGNTEIITVTSVPTGAATSGPNVMAYALQTRHSVGTVMHRRMNPLRWSRWESACLQFVNQDAAQEAFLAAGGPERDSQHLDPDGDGFACWWDPQVYRQAVALGR